MSSKNIVTTLMFSLLTASAIAAEDDVAARLAKAVSEKNASSLGDYILNAAENHPKLTFAVMSTPVVGGLGYGAYRFSQSQRYARMLKWAGKNPGKSLGLFVLGTTGVAVTGLVIGAFVLLMGVTDLVVDRIKK